MTLEGEHRYFVAAQQIAGFSKLDPGWNSYRAGRVGEHARVRAMDFLAAFREGGWCAPEVDPTPDGGVQLSWAVMTPKGALEIEIVILDKSGEFSVGFVEHDGFETSGTVVEDPKAFVPKLSEIVEPLLLAA